MSNKNISLQRRAATMFVAGYSSAQIVKELGVRYSTLVRWQKTACYREHVVRLQDELRQQLSVRLLRLFDDCVDATRDAMQTDADNLTIDHKSASLVMEMIKAIGKENVFRSAEMENSAKTTPKKRQTAPKLRQTAPHQPQMAPLPPDYTPNPPTDAGLPAPPP